jgi:predicted  nucleic acid-binding Zn-ribbon protein
MGEESKDKKKIDIQQMLKEIQADYDDKLDAIDHRIEEELTPLMVKPVQLATRKNELYALRQELIRYRLDLMKRGSLITKIRKQVKNDLYLSYKLGRKIDTKSNTAILFKNDYERTTFLEADLKNVDYVKEYVDNLISFINESIGNIKDMIFGIGYVIEMENKYKQG